VSVGAISDKTYLTPIFRVVTGKHEETDEDKKGGFVRRERRYGSFSRSMTLPKGVSADQIEASCKDGMLEVTIPRPKEAQRQKVTITPKSD
jgi:HSP20 family protein